MPNPAPVVVQIIASHLFLIPANISPKILLSAEGCPVSLGFALCRQKTGQNQHV